MNPGSFFTISTDFYSVPGVGVYHRRLLVLRGGSMLCGRWGLAQVKSSMPVVAIGPIGLSWEENTLRVGVGFRMYLEVFNILFEEDFNIIYAGGKGIGYCSKSLHR